MTESRRLRRSRLPVPATTRAGGFTLIELMVSIALALLLVIGINAVFKMSSDTVGSGMQMSEMMRQLRTAQNALGNDFDTTHFAPNTMNPALIIESYNQPAFRDRNDELAAINVAGGYDPTSTDIDKAQTATLNVRDADGNPVYPLAGWGVAGISGSNINVAFPQVINNRNHRVDVLSFFVRNPNSLQRQTPNYPDGTMDASGSGSGLLPQYQGRYKSTQAWVVYGHVLQPDNTVNAQNLLTYNPGTNAGGQTHFLGLGLTRDPYTGALYTSGATPIATNQNQPNPNNFYSNQWVLGRTSILMGDPTDLDTYTNPYSNNNPAAPVIDPQTYAKDLFANLPDPKPAAVTEALRPLSWGTPIWGTRAGAPVALTSPNNTSPPVVGTTGGIEIQTSQADVAGATLQTMHDKTLAAENPTATPNIYLNQWYMPLVAMGYGQAPEQQNPEIPNGSPKPNSWIWPSNPTPNTQLGYWPWHAYRFMAQAWPDKLAANGQPMTAANIAAMHQQLAVQTPIFLRGCSQFIVEYAGDYVQQKNQNGPDATDPNGLLPAGAITNIGEDGQIDFDAVTDPTSAGGTAVIKKIRWYGMTRSLDDGVSVEDTTKEMIVQQPATPGSPPVNQQIVRPLYRYIQQYTAKGGLVGTTPNLAFTHMPFEKVNIASGSPGGPWYTGFPDTHPANVDSYTCAWGPLEMDLDKVPAVPFTFANDVGGWQQLQPLVQPLTTTQFPSRSLLPWMIRVTVRLDDPSGRMPDGQTMQFVYTIPRPH